MKISVACASGVEAVTKRELLKLGITDAPAINGRISYEGTEADVCKANLYLRTANRVFVTLAEFKVGCFDDLFDGVYAINWSDYVAEDGKVEVSAKCFQSAIHALSATQSVVKKAICKKLSKRGELAETGERYKVEVSMYRDMCTVSLDTSGEGLHKRGYRKVVGEAPLKETLAAAIIELSVWKPERPFFDAFCGSGTFVVEAAMMAKNIPSGYMRDFDFLHWKGFDKSAFFDEKKLAAEQIRQTIPNELVGYDIEENQLALAERHARNAGVSDVVRFEKADMATFKSELSRGVVFANPPYGERLADRSEIEELYRNFGKMVKALPDWCAYTLTPVTDFERLFGKKADKTRKLYNGNIECKLFMHLASKN